jgi:hypothetical protein
LFWDADFDAVDPDAHADGVIARVLEHGRLDDVRLVRARYGDARILAFFRGAPHPEISGPTRALWRLVLGAGDEVWPISPDFRRSSDGLWPD